MRTMRTLYLIAAMFCWLTVNATSAFAADAADRTVIGFSKDGRYFAFEEYGIQDGSGFPYSSIYITDLQTDTWVEGTPVRVQMREEGATAYGARHKALTQAAPLIEEFGTIQPAKTLASNAVGEEVADPHMMKFKRFHNLSTLWTVKLTHVDLATPPDCQSLPGIKGFALSVAVDNGELKEVYRDKDLPKSRGCPENYRLADVLSFGENENGRVVVLIHMLTFGFEGRDSRFVAVPVKLPSWR